MGSAHSGSHSAEHVSKTSSFLKNCWYVAAFDHALTDEGFSAIRILDQPVLLYRKSDGVPVALQDRCPHRMVPLSIGQRVGDEIQCGYHGMRFDRRGACTFIPGQQRIPLTACVKTYPLVARHGHLWIWMGDADSVDEDLIPDLPWPTLDGWRASFGYLKVAADYRLLSDNLLDLSHETYVHGGTIGNSTEESIADYQPRIEASATSVSVHRQMPAIYPPPTFQLIMGSDDVINRWQTAIWHAPSHNMTHVGAYFTHQAQSEARETRVLHLLTPETRTSTHYFWSASRNFRLDEEKLTQGIDRALVATFLEDKAMLEAQQSNITDWNGPMPGVALMVDNAPMRARRSLARLISSEAVAQAGKPADRTR